MYLVYTALSMVETRICAATTFAAGKYNLLQTGMNYVVLGYYIDATEKFHKPRTLK